MRKIDRWVIAILEIFCHKLQRLTGIRSAHMANTAFMLASFWLIQEMLSGNNKITKYMGWFVIIGYFVYGRQAMNRDPNLGNEATANPLKANLFEIHWRVFGLILGCLAFPLDLGSKNFWLEASVLGSYFAACDDLPISPSKLKQWLGSFNRQPELQPVESEC